MDRTQMSLKTFYADRVRQRSEERSFGKHSRAEGRAEFQVFWLRDTGELIVVGTQTTSGAQLGDGGDSIFCVVAGFAVDLVVEGVLHQVTDRTSEVEILAIIADDRAVDGLLAGWEEHEQSGTGLAWLRERTARPPETAENDVPPGAAARHSRPTGDFRAARRPCGA